MHDCAFVCAIKVCCHIPCDLVPLHCRQPKSVVQVTIPLILEYLERYLDVSEERDGPVRRRGRERECAGAGVGVGAGVRTRSGVRKCGAVQRLAKAPNSHIRIREKHASHELD
jgi:hypothetical protein